MITLAILHNRPRCQWERQGPSPLYSSDPNRGRSRVSAESRPSFTMRHNWLTMITVYPQTGPTVLILPGFDPGRRLKKAHWNLAHLKPPRPVLGFASCFILASFNSEPIGKDYFLHCLFTFLRRKMYLLKLSSQIYSNRFARCNIHETSSGSFSPEIHPDHGHVAR